MDSESHVMEARDGKKTKGAWVRTKVEERKKIN